MSVSVIVVTNTSGTKLSLVGDDGSARYDIENVAGSNTLDIDLNVLLGNVLLCSTLSTWVTSGNVTITRGGVTITAAMLTAWEQGSDMSTNEYDLDSDQVVDAAEAISDGTTSLTVAQILGNSATAASAAAQVASEVFGHADLTAAAGTETLTFAVALPATAIVLGAYLGVTEAFDNAGVTATTTCDVGLAASDEFLNAAAMDAIATVGAPVGTTPMLMSFGGVSITVKVDSDVNVDTLTTGSMTVHVIYIEAAEAIA